MEPIPIETFFDKSKQQQQSAPPQQSEHKKTTTSALLDLFANIHFLGFLQQLFIAMVLLMFARQMLHGRGGFAAL